MALLRERVATDLSVSVFIVLFFFTLWQTQPRFLIAELVVRLRGVGKSTLVHLKQRERCS